MSLAALSGKRVVVTGGAGAFGKHLVAALAAAPPASLLVLSRDEMKHAALRREAAGPLKSWLRLKNGDVTRPEDCAQALRGADVVIHAAAMKHVPECELNPRASTLVNVVGTLNVVDAFLASSATTLVFLSSDKAPYASTGYGAQKLLAERLVADASPDGKRAFTLRYSNVLDSTGAAFLLFRQLLSEGKTVTVNGSQTSRGFVSQAEVMACLGKGLEVTRGGEVFVPVPRVILIAEMARAMRAIIGKGEVVVTEQASFAGEKESATLIMAEETGVTRSLPEFEAPAGFLVDTLRRHPEREAAAGLDRDGLTLDGCPRLQGPDLSAYLASVLARS